MSDTVPVHSATKWQDEGGNTQTKYTAEEGKRDTDGSN